MPPKLRQHVSGHSKRLKKRKIEEANKKEFWSMHRYVKIKSDVTSENLNVDINDSDSYSSNDESADDVNVDNMEADNINDVDEVDDVVANDHDDQVEDRDTSVNVDNVDIFDPKNWESLTSDMINVLVTEGPKRDKSTEKGPKDKNSRRFSDAFYTRVLPNNEKCDREWSVYSKKHDKVFCFCCKIHKKGIGKGQLANEGFGDLQHLGHRLKEHEVSLEHVNNIGKWFEMRRRLKKNETIDKVEQKQFEKERDHWKNVIFRIISIVKFLAKHNLAFRGSNERLYQKNNGNFLGLIEMLEVFDPFIKEHVRRITSEEIQVHYLGFLNVDDTTGQGLFDVTQAELKALDLDIDDVRGQGYDNGSNMKGKHRGVQKRFIDINPRAFYIPCDFFAIIQRIYTIFASSSKRWQILKDNVKGLTPKSLSTTRCESRVESVKAIKFQLSDIREALIQVSEKDNDFVIQSQAKSLATNELGDFEFIAAIVIWFEILNRVNLVSKKLQSDDMLINVAMTEVQDLISFFKEFRVTGFSNAVDVAKQIAIEMDINPLFIRKRVIRRKRQFDEDSVEEDVILSAEESFKVNYFLYIVDQAIASLTTRFEQYQEYENMFGFLFTCDKLKFYDDDRLKSCCSRLEAALKSGDRSDINANELYVELRSLNSYLPIENMKPVDVLNFLKQDDCYPNAIIAYRVLLTIPVTVASAERSFSKLKLLKSYLRSTMSQERLNGLALIAIENDTLESVTYDDLINNFASKNARRIALFK
ncbi:zinc finger MYM-type protein 1 [Artemisia annua]|uniref:Zinc finger MYM-type protein 1 n=1 Tax=Artemisia annua TaxID=35608 RepID=A0A2U1M0M7_ARTAN|nr:zinc finger MYM-type protein 1 [Artemisia annua]